MSFTPRSQTEEFTEKLPKDFVKALSRAVLCAPVGHDTLGIELTFTKTAMHIICVDGVVGAEVTLPRDSHDSHDGDEVRRVHIRYDEHLMKALRSLKPATLKAEHGTVEFSGVNWWDTGTVPRIGCPMSAQVDKFTRDGQIRNTEPIANFAISTRALALIPKVFGHTKRTRIEDLAISITGGGLGSRGYGEPYIITQNTDSSTRMMIMPISLGVVK